MNKLKNIIGRMLTAILIINQVTLPALAQTAPETECQGDKPDFEALMEEWQALENKTMDATQEIIDEAKQQHHDYVGCMFGFAEAQFLDAVQDWNAPDQVCALIPDEIKQMIQKTEPGEMLGPMLDSHKAYKDFLNQIGENLVNSIAIVSESGVTVTGMEALNKVKPQLLTSDRQIRMEITSSLVAIDLSFTALKELRLATVMHAHFMCIMQSLEKYRKALGEMRSLVMALPGLVRDASVVK